MQYREIGDEVHMTGQAVANRIKAMQGSGIIEGFTVKIDESRLGKTIQAFITVFMKTTDHAAFQAYIKNQEIISEASQISGEGCYMLKASAVDQNELLELLNGILKYGNYRVNVSIGRIKG